MSSTSHPIIVNGGGVYGEFVQREASCQARGQCERPVQTGRRFQGETDDIRVEVARGFRIQSGYEACGMIRLEAHDVV